MDEIPSEFEQVGATEEEEVKSGGGFLNDLIDQIPFELHFPNYEFCGAGTKLAERLERGQVGVNPLDRCCRQHDLAYAATKGIGRARADAILAEQALSRMLNGEASSDERVAALMTACCMVSKITFEKLLGRIKRGFSRAKKNHGKEKGKNKKDSRKTASGKKQKSKR